MTHRNQIRLAQDRDVDALVEVLGDREFVKDRLDRQAAGLGELLTIWSGDVLLGSMYIWLEDAEEPELRKWLPGVPLFTRIEVLERYRGKGIGTKLIRAGEDRLRKAGYRSVALAVEITNFGAELLYKRLYFDEWEHGQITCEGVEVLEDGYRKPYKETCRIMVKRLED
ncbi:Predicted N-acetyltransferase YhbS [Amycolatopsis xylanica]|uniref:Predicted N-acetyltransferase YhbS n=1 Tax=Amycolatopsis xylanica TaxID=589385 RepID=A0A1H3SXM1_9PSEU|nr:GNAT family N-acetyltransferase [Amycolatopsis xylanica]SDZ42378.1 Predicted N-acetyltransferase YhbS [Amycolatopsis xylanica]